MADLRERVARILHEFGSALVCRMCETLEPGTEDYWIGRLTRPYEDLNDAEKTGPQLFSDRIIALVRADERARIFEALETPSEEALLSGEDAACDGILKASDPNIAGDVWRAMLAAERKRIEGEAT